MQDSAPLPDVLEPALTLRDIEQLDQDLKHYFQPRFFVQPFLTRSLVSFQGNKAQPGYRWYKFKEAFSAALVEDLFHKYAVSAGKILDPFAGSGTALFAASRLGIASDGIELLPIGQHIIAARQLLETNFNADDLNTLRQWAQATPWRHVEKRAPMPELRITRGAYPAATQEAIEKYLGACQQENSKLQYVLRFVLLCVLESISYTRKDGQYLRWDHRSGRSQGAKLFDKGPILELEQALSEKIAEIVADLQPGTGQLNLFPLSDCSALLDSTPVPAWKLCQLCPIAPTRPSSHHRLTAIAMTTPVPTPLNWLYWVSAKKICFSCDNRC